MDIWVYWALGALLLFIVELFTTGFAVICLSIGALGGTVAALCGASLEVQILVFAVVSFIALLGVRPLLKRLFFKDGDKVATNADAILGKRGVVCVAIAADDDTGRVMIDGMDWRARSEDGCALDEGTKVEVVGRDSVILIVKKL